MADTVKGKIIRVVDGDTFDLQITNVGNNNAYKYSNTERIRMAGKDEPELNTLLGLAVKRRITEKLLNKIVICEIQGRDTYGRLVAKIK